MHTVEVSIDGCTAFTHDAVRGRPGSFERAVTAVKLLSEAGVKVIVAFSAMHQNVHEFERLVDIVAPLGACSVVATRRLLPLGRATTNPQLNLTDSDTELLIKQVEHARQNYPGIGVNATDNAATWLEDVRNELPNYRMMIAPDGAIKLMPFVPFTFGNILTDDLDTVWRQTLSSIIENRVFRQYMAGMLTTGSLKDQSILPYRDDDIAFASLGQARVMPSAIQHPQ
jgi:MoaA/NifB/PqqE/SkfB family radical SAM enzyme